MWRSREPRFDVASAISMGARSYQEDAITSDFLVGADSGFVVVADGMGGHAAGDVASKLVLTTVYSELKFHYADVDAFEADAHRILGEIAQKANASIRERIALVPETKGMGSTLVVPIINENRLYWLSIGDSPLYRLRNGKLTQLNADHSLAPQIDMMAKAGMLSPEAAQNHPDRNCLVSALMGGKIAKIDCPEKPEQLQTGDILLCGSDGMQVLPDAQIERLLNKYRRKRASEIAENLLDEVLKADDPQQDNVSFCVIKINDAKASPREDRALLRRRATQQVELLTRLAEEPGTAA
ncbi:PP2C family protein-serine/threonine phosphatase [Albidovulum sp.]|uniref:PP2C family protein-serine/threonine phosphatase n=1 Tax=Albidovulum sp. TaxID=1872424 RepID=UPI001DAF7E9C|nr:serine/threonine-protein phosphatase [Paracoccaceae bacterium]MCC0046715.1 serine/threonine-protein phosphatase [Defluviimonas sp.]HPE24928.1 SpoIIE family protein phosphatase [Albidovulum sp.]MCB2119659.1 serine/threonine-protein phosphatase [Paracoccaceae bacterium]MCB2131732.1 serine/threonine-protein phosphatase [Paracoccaceae bacterium]